MTKLPARQPQPVPSLITAGRLPARIARYWNRSQLSMGDLMLLNNVQVICGNLVLLAPFSCFCSEFGLGTAPQVSWRGWE